MSMSLVQTPRFYKLFRPLYSTDVVLVVHKPHVERMYFAKEIHISDFVFIYPSKSPKRSPFSWQGIHSILAIIKITQSACSPMQIHMVCLNATDFSLHVFLNINDLNGILHLFHPWSTFT